MAEGKVNTDKKYPVLLYSSSDFISRVTGKSESDITVKYCKEGDSSLSSYSPSASDWDESGEGKYWLNIGASEFTTTNTTYEVTVSCAGCIDANFKVEVRNKFISETQNDIISISSAVDALHDLSVSDVDSAISSNDTITDMDAAINALHNIAISDVDSTISSNTTITEMSATVIDIDAAIGSLNNIAASDVDAAISANSDINNIGTGVSNVEAAVNALNNIAVSDVDQAITDNSDINDIQSTITNVEAAVNSLNDLAVSDVQSACDAAVTANTSVAKESTTQSAIAGVSAQISGLNDPTANAIRDAILNAVANNFTTSGSIGEALMLACTASAGQFRLYNDSGDGEKLKVDFTDYAGAVVKTLEILNPAGLNITDALDSDALAERA